MTLLFSALSAALFILAIAVFALAGRQKMLLQAIETMAETQESCRVVVEAHQRSIGANCEAIKFLAEGNILVGKYMQETNARLRKIERNAVPRDPRTGEVQH